MKKCTKCGIEKSFREFQKNKKYKDGFCYWCKCCMKIYKAAYTVDTRLAKRAKDLKRNFGLSLDEFDSLLSLQGNKCGICGASECSSGRNFCVDHNHDTGEIRGILCTPCNTAIGRFQDNPSILKNAYQYLIEKGHYGQEAA